MFSNYCSKILASRFPQAINLIEDFCKNNNLQLGSWLYLSRIFGEPTSDYYSEVWSNTEMSYRRYFIITNYKSNIFVDVLMAVDKHTDDSYYDSDIILNLLRNDFRNKINPNEFVVTDTLNMLIKNDDKYNPLIVDYVSKYNYDVAFGKFEFWINNKYL
jgi:hypothetical protein